MSEVVNSLEEAKTGDLVWLWDGNSNRYSAGGKYEGRGVWRTDTILSENRASFIVHQSKFDRKTGVVRATNGYTPQQWIAGNIDKENRDWLSAAYRVGDLVSKSSDINKLKAVAEIMGFNL